MNIFRIGRTWFRQREMFGYWLAPEIKKQVFEAIEKFVVKHQIPLNCRGTMPDRHCNVPTAGRSYARTGV